MIGFRYVALMGGLAAALLITSCGKKEQEAEEIVRPVRYERVFMTGGARVRTFSGTAQANLESRLSFRVGGTLDALPVKVGDRVRKDQVLATLDSNDYRLRQQEAEASLAQVQAQERNARSTYDRVRALYENRNASKQDLDAARAAHESASAQVRTSEKRLELAHLQVSYTELKAPYDGAVADVRVDENENVGSGTPVILLTAGGHPEVKVSIPEVLISQIEQGSSATVTFDAIPNAKLESTITEVGVTSTGFATTFPVTVRLNQPTDQVRPGMAAEVAFHFESGGTQERVILAPVAVAEDHQGRFVFVVTPEGDGLGITHRTPVSVGDLTSEGLEILDGLQEGDLVVTAGVHRIADGQRVKLW